MTNKLSHNQNLGDLDANNDGKLSAQNIIMQYDQNGDGLLDQNEFNDLKNQIMEQQRYQVSSKLYILCIYRLYL